MLEFVFIESFKFLSPAFAKPLTVGGKCNETLLTNDDLDKIRHMKAIKYLAIVLSIIAVGCAPLKQVTVVKNDKIENYKYIYISPTKSLTSSSGGVYGGNYGMYGSSTSKSVNPSDVIAGILLKEGFSQLPELKPKLADETLIVNYGESGRRNRGLGYTIEVTIQFLSAKTNTTVCSCTAEGQGETEADDIRQAITRCLKGLLSKEN